MKKVFFITVLLSGLVSCKFAAKELKKVSKIRNAAKEVCDCKHVEVNSDYDFGTGEVTISVKHVQNDDYTGTADKIMTNVKDKFANICNHDEIFIIFEGDDFDQQYTYYGCNMSPEIDTIYHDYDDYDDFEEFGEDFEEEEPTPSEAPPPPPPVPVQEIDIEELEIEEEIEEIINQ